MTRSGIAVAADYLLWEGVRVTDAFADPATERYSSLAVNDDSQYRPLRGTCLWLGHHTDTSWVPEHTTQHQKVQQPHIYKFTKTNNLE